MTEAKDPARTDGKEDKGGGSTLAHDRRQEEAGFNNPNSLATAALACGVVGILLGLVPVVGLLGLILGIAAVVLGVVSNKKTKSNDDSRPRARKGIVTGVIAIVVSIISTALLTSVVVNFFDDMTNNISDTPDLYNLDPGSEG